MCTIRVDRAMTLGESCSFSVASLNRYKFTGKERDSESGLDMFGARYYGSSLGRFMTPDWAARPTTVPYANFGNPQTLNLYSYVRNNPTSFYDRDGHCWSWLQGACNFFQKAYYGVFTDYGFKTNAQVTEVNKQNRQWLIDHNVVTPDKKGNTIDWNNASGGQVRTAYAATVNAMILRLIHGPETIRGEALDSARKMSTEEIIASLKNGFGPNGEEQAVIKPDGTVMNGNTRLTVLRERGVDINSLGLKPDPMYEEFSQVEQSIAEQGMVQETTPVEEIPAAPGEESEEGPE